ncbi:hypothetical protein LZ30DRAFT_355742 [Colletotrichum cereale]|nr:hypothetical protein LZ30DRAFT_355742 [Colletotrichum cereale]
MAPRQGRAAGRASRADAEDHISPHALLHPLRSRHAVGMTIWLASFDSQLDPIVRRWQARSTSSQRWQVTSCSPSAQGPALTRRCTPARRLPLPPLIVEMPSATEVMRRLIGLEWTPQTPPREDYDPCHFYPAAPRLALPPAIGAPSHAQRE